MCMTNADCCEKEHVCRPADGFIYDRCLKPVSALGTTRASALTIFVAVFMATALSALVTDIHLLAS